MTDRPSPIRILLLGANGRMGKTVSSLIDQDESLQLLAALGSKSHPDSLTLNGISDRMVLIDFSLPGVIDAWLPLCKQYGIGIVSGVTGMSDQQLAALKQAGQDTSVLWGSNLSTGVALMTDAIARMSRWKTGETRAALLDEHHDQKRDRPSGTALSLVGAWLHPDSDVPMTSEQMCWSEESERMSAGQIDDLAISVRREGDIIGHHQFTIRFADETLILDHQVTDRAVFARGALTATRWLASRKSGYYLFAEMFRLT